MHQPTMRLRIGKGSVVTNVALELRARHDRGEQGARQAIERELAKYQFYHRLEILPGVFTRGLSSHGYDWADDLVARIVAAMGTIELHGKRILDIGCRDGALSFAAEKMGAAEVIGIDNDLSPGLTEFLIPFKGSKLRAHSCNVNNLSRDRFGEFDIVIFPGVLYHLRYPIWALRRISDVLKPGGTLLIEGGFVDGLADLPVMFCPVGTDSPYEPTSVTFFNAAGLTATLLSLGFADIKCLGTITRMSRLYTFRFFATKFPRFLLWRFGIPPSISRKLFSCVKRWSDDDRLAYVGSYDARDVLTRYWDGTHALHDGTSS
jgi:SAM-dependent methyltransferase